MQKVNEWAQHELDSDRLMKMLIVLAASCRYGSEEVYVKPSRHQILKLEACKFFEGGVPAHLMVDLGPASSLVYFDILHDVDLMIHQSFN